MPKHLPKAAPILFMHGFLSGFSSRQVIIVTSNSGLGSSLLSTSLRQTAATSPSARFLTMKDTSSTIWCSTSCLIQGRHSFSAFNPRTVPIGSTGKKFSIKKSHTSSTSEGRMVRNSSPFSRTSDSLTSKGSWRTTAT